MSDNPKATPATTGQVKTVIGKAAMALPEMTEPVATIWATGKSALLKQRMNNLRYRPARFRSNNIEKRDMPWLKPLIDEALIELVPDNKLSEGMVHDLELLIGLSGGDLDPESRTRKIYLASPHNGSREPDDPPNFHRFVMEHNEADPDPKGMEWLLRRLIHEMRDELLVT